MGFERISFSVVYAAAYMIPLLRLKPGNDAQVAAVDSPSMAAEIKSQEMRDINPHDWLAAAQGQQPSDESSWLQCAPFPGALPRQTSLC